MSISFKMLSKVLPMVTTVKKPVLLRARHGVGKSACVYAFAEHIKLPVIERRASQMTEGDLLGLPSVEGNSTRWNAPDWLKEACESPVVLFIDEIDRATQEVRQGFFELTDSRKINGWHLHPDTLIFAAINGGEHAQQYQIGEMDPAEVDRWTVFDVEPTVEDWLNWAKDNCSEVVWDFINQNHAHLEHDSDYEPNKVYPSRRSWHRFSDVLREHEERLIVPGEHVPELAFVCQAFCGLEASVAFVDFIKNMKKQVKPEDIINKGNFKLVDKFTLNDHTALVEKIIAKGFLTRKRKLNKKQQANLAKYFVMLPSEAAMVLFTAFQDGDKVIELFLDLYKLDGVQEKVLKIIGETEEKNKDDK